MWRRSALRPGTERGSLHSRTPLQILFPPHLSTPAPALHDLTSALFPAHPAEDHVPPSRRETARRPSPTRPRLHHCSPHDEHPLTPHSVRRSDLFSSASSPTSSRQSSPVSDPELTALLRARLDEQLGTAITDAPQPASQDRARPAPAHDDDDDEDDELEFRLFAPAKAPAAKPTKSAPSAAAAAAAARTAGSENAAVQKIRLRSPSLDPDRPAGFVVAARPQSYYFAPPLASAANGADYADAAVAGDEVVRLARATRWPGCAVPWRVSVVDAASGRLRRALEGHVVDGAEGRDEEKRRRRKSKKARIALRKKREQGLERKQAAERQKLEKEEHERAKRAEKNRKQKLKRREKERAKKAAERGEAGGENEDVDMSED